MRAAASRLMARDFAKSSAKDFEAFALPSARGRLASTPTSTMVDVLPSAKVTGRLPLTGIYSRRPASAGSPGATGERAAVFALCGSRHKVSPHVGNDLPRHRNGLLGDP